MMFVIQPRANGEAARFLEFARQSRDLLSRLNTEKFGAFVEKATPLVTARLRADVAVIESDAKRLEPWISDWDLLAAAGLSFVENAYTELMAWALQPTTHPATALARQRAWLEQLEFARLPLPTAPAVAQTQFATHDGIPDLVLDYGSFIVVVEAKTGSAEHATPLGSQQTEAYAGSVPKRLGRTDCPTFVVFITPSGVEPANREALPTTYARFALSLATTLDRTALPVDLGAAFATLITHFLTCATPRGTGVVRVIRHVAAWSKAASPTALLADSENIHAAAAALRPSREIQT